MKTKKQLKNLKEEMARINFIARAHSLKPIESHKAHRKVDKRLPYYTHPLWCALTILYEEKLEWKTKREGYLALLHHDILEDTKEKLPKNLSPRVKKLIKELTFENGTEQEKKEIWGKSKEARLYKLYDKVSNLLDKRWLTPEKKKSYEDYAKKLCEDVEKNFGELNITRIARTILGLELQDKKICGRMK
jgi:hypothetical protein